MDKHYVEKRVADIRHLLTRVMIAIEDDKDLDAIARLNDVRGIAGGLADYIACHDVEP